MTTLSNYVHSLCTAIASIGTRASGNAMPQISDSQRNVQTHPFTVQSMELMIPMVIHEAAQPAPGRPSKTIGLWLEMHTHQEIQQLLHLDQVPKVAHDRLQKTITERTLKVQSLLEQEEVAVDQVFLDYAQAVLAVAWDEYGQNTRKGNTRHKSANSVDAQDSFEQMTQQLVTRLRQKHALRHTPAQPETIQVTVETQKLSEFPAHALTYIKLLITGDGISMRELECLQS